MDLLNKLTKKNLKLNKKRTIVTIIGIILSIALLTAVSTVYMSGLKSLEDYEIKITGNYHFMLRNVASSEKERIKLIDSVERVSESKLVGYAKIDSQNKDKPYAAITEFDKNAINTIGFKMKKGRLPENDSEIVIPSHLYTNGRLELNVGDKITLNVGKRVIGNEELNQFNMEMDKQFYDLSNKFQEMQKQLQQNHEEELRKFQEEYEAKNSNLNPKPTSDLITANKKLDLFVKKKE